MKTSRRNDDSAAGCSKVKPKARRIPSEYKAEYEEHHRLLTALMFNNPLCTKPKNSRCNLFPLEECSDIEPISEDDEVDKPICEIQPFDTVPRVYGTSSLASYPCVEDEKSKDWMLPPRAKKYVKEVVLQEWTDYHSKNSDTLAHVSKKEKQQMKEDVISEAMEFVTTSIRDRVMCRRVVDGKSIKMKDSK